MVPVRVAVALGDNDDGGDAAPDDAVRVDNLAAGPLLREATDLVEKIWAMTS